MTHERAERWLIHVRRKLFAIILSLAGLTPHCSEASSRLHACQQGFVQRSPLVLGCHGGNMRTKIELEGVGHLHQGLFWKAPSGTKDLRATAMLSPTFGGQGRATLKVTCTDSGEVLVGAESGILNQHRTYAKIHGAHWQWGRDSKADYGETFEEWFRVDGLLPCDVDISLLNEQGSRLSGTLHYEWSSILECPRVPLGCKPCAEEGAMCSDIGKIAICDGSAHIDCKTAGELKAENDARHFSFTRTATTKPSTATISTTSMETSTSTWSVSAANVSLIPAVVSANFLTPPPTTQKNQSLGANANFQSNSSIIGVQPTGFPSSFREGTRLPTAKPSQMLFSGGTRVSFLMFGVLAAVSCICMCNYVRRTRPKRTHEPVIKETPVLQHQSQTEDIWQRKDVDDLSKIVSRMEAGPRGYEPVRSDESFHSDQPLASAKLGEPAHATPLLSDGM